MDSCCLTTYATLCALALAKSHARSGNRSAIAEAIASTKRFPGKLARYAVSGANQVELDFKAYLRMGG